MSTAHSFTDSISSFSLDTIFSDSFFTNNASHDPLFPPLDYSTSSIDLFNSTLSFNDNLISSSDSMDIDQLLSLSSSDSSMSSSDSLISSTSAPNNPLFSTSTSPLSNSIQSPDHFNFGEMFLSSFNDTFADNSPATFSTLLSPMTFPSSLPLPPAPKTGTDERERASSMFLSSCNDTFADNLPTQFSTLLSPMTFPSPTNTYSTSVTNSPMVGPKFLNPMGTDNSPTQFSALSSPMTFPSPLPFPPASKTLPTQFSTTSSRATSVANSPMVGPKATDSLPLPPAPKTGTNEKERALDDALLRINFDDVTVSELKDMLRMRGRQPTGRKAVLIERIKEEIQLVQTKRQAGGTIASYNSPISIPNNNHNNNNSTVPIVMNQQPSVSPPVPSSTFFNCNPFVSQTPYSPDVPTTSDTAIHYMNPFPFPLTVVP